MDARRPQKVPGSSGSRLADGHAIRRGHSTGSAMPGLRYALCGCSRYTKPNIERAPWTHGKQLSAKAFGRT